MVAVVSEMLKLRGFQVVQSDPLLEGGAQATDRDKGNFQFTSPFSISTLQREIHGKQLFTFAYQTDTTARVSSTIKTVLAGLT